MSDSITFSRSLYEPTAVQDAIAAYVDLAKFSVVLGDNDIVVTLSDIDEDVAECLVDEFCNHVLVESIVVKRGGDGQSQDAPAALPKAASEERS